MIFIGCTPRKFYERVNCISFDETSDAVQHKHCRLTEHCKIYIRGKDRCKRPSRSEQTRDIKAPTYISIFYTTLGLL